MLWAFCRFEKELSTLLYACHLSYFYSMLLTTKNINPDQPLMRLLEIPFRLPWFELTLGPDKI